MIEIPLISGIENSHQEFSVQLGDKLFEFILDWNYKYNNWSVNVDIDGGRVISGAVLAANSCLNRWTSGIGRLYFVGEDATIDNLGEPNKLVWVADPEKERKTAIPAQPSFCDGPKDDFYACLLSSINVAPAQAYAFNDLLPSTILADSGELCTDGTLVPERGLLESPSVVQQADSKGLRILNNGSAGTVFSAPNNVSSSTETLMVSFFFESESATVGQYWSHSFDIGNTQIRVQNQQVSVRADKTNFSTVNAVYYNFRTTGKGAVHIAAIVSASSGGQSASVSIYINGKLIWKIDIDDVTVPANPEIIYTKFSVTEIRLDQLYFYKGTEFSDSDIEQIYLCGTGNAPMAVTFEGFTSERFEEQGPDYWYKLNDAAGTVAIDSGKKGQNGTLSSLVALGQPPLVVQAGSSSGLVSGGSNLLFSAPLTGYDPNRSLHCEFWIKPVSSSGWALTFDFQFGGFAFTSTGYSYLMIGDNGNDINGSFPYNFVQGSIYYISCTYTNHNDGSGIIASVYINNGFMSSDSSPDEIQLINPPGIYLYGSGDVLIDQIIINEDNELSDFNCYRIGAGILS